MSPVLIVVACASFVSSLFIRLTDPLVPQLAVDFAVDPRTAALLGTAFALPWALVQPLLGPVGDLVGKTRVVLTCLCILLASAVVGALATSFPLLMASRIIAGGAAGGIFPVSMAIYGDFVPVEQRQVGMGRLLTASISGMLMGGAFAGILADFVPWRWVFVVYGCGVVAAIAAVALTLRRTTASAPRRVDIPSIVANYRRVLSNPRAKICYGAVFFEGIAMVGVFPFVAVLLVSIGEPRASIAGLILAAFNLGGVIYSLLVRNLVRMLTPRQLMIAGGALAGAALAAEALAPPWPVQMLLFLLMGFGFYTLHACILVQMTELAPEARGTATAGHAFAYYSGQSLGPVVYGIGYGSIGLPATILASAAVIVTIGWLCARLLHGPPAPAP
ncbi:MAG: MFS transporter [Variibacter sp.]|nr:MFS transporter [Variibacter sp.]